MSKTGSYFRCKSILLMLIITLCVPFASSLRAADSEAVVTNRFANVRSGPGTQYTRLGRVYQGNRFQVTTIRPEWVEIIYKGRPAWIFRQLVSLTSSGPSESEVDRVEIRVEDLNNRLDRLVDKLERATELVEQRYPDSAMAAPEMQKKAKQMRMEPLPRVSPAWVFIPGGPRLAAGDRWRGWGLMGVTLACAGGGYYYYDQYQGFKDDYKELDSAAMPEEFQRLVDKADSRHKVSNGLIYATAGLYAVNVLDYFFFLPRSVAGMQVNSQPEPGGRIKLSMSTDF
jgi:hypothetical protein